MKTSTIQKLMDDAYSKWEKKEYDSHKQMLERSDKNTQISILCGNLNSQVENGGYIQWVDNGYAIDILLLLKYLEEIGTPACMKVHDMTEKLITYLNFEESCYWQMTEGSSEPCEWCDGSGYINDDIRDEECGDCDGFGEIDVEPEIDIPDFIDEIDDDYYMINEAFLSEVEEYISKNA